MNEIDIINAKLNEISNKIKQENKKIVLTRKQCELMSKTLTKSKRSKK